MLHNLEGKASNYAHDICSKKQLQNMQWVWLPRCQHLHLVHSCQTPKSRKDTDSKIKTKQHQQFPLLRWLEHDAVSL
eukprot:4715804-Amphidinium_carterae.1